MPRAEQSGAGKVLAYFRTTDLVIANEIFSLVQDTMRERRAKSEKGKAAQTKRAPVAAAAAPVAAPVAAPQGKVKPAKAAKPKKAKAKKARKPQPAAEPAPAQEQELAAEPEFQEYPVGEGAGDGGEPIDQQ